MTVAHPRLLWSVGEIFVPADQFDRLKVNRVVPLDAIAREEYGEHGWIEGSHGHEFDTGKEIAARGNERPCRDYTYDKDTRNMSRSEADQTTLQCRLQGAFEVPVISQ